MTSMTSTYPLLPFSPKQRTMKDEDVEAQNKNEYSAVTCLMEKPPHIDNKVKVSALQNGSPFVAAKTKETWNIFP